MSVIFEVIVMQHVKRLDGHKLEVVPQVADRKKIHFQLNSLRNLLPFVVVKVLLQHTR